MDQVFLFYSAWFAGGVAGKLTDPLSWVLIGLMWLAGHLRTPVWWIVVGAAGATAISVAAVWTWWAELGYASQWPRRTGQLLVLFLAISAMAYAIGRLTAGIFNRVRRARPSEGVEQLATQYFAGQALAVAIAEAVRGHLAEIQSGRVTFPAHRRKDASVVAIWRDLRLEALSRLFRFGQSDPMLLADPRSQYKLLCCFLDEQPHLEMPQPRGEVMADTIQAMWQVYVFLDAAGSEVVDRETDRVWLKAQQRDILTVISHQATALRQQWGAFNQRPTHEMPDTLIQALYVDVTRKTKSIALSVRLGPEYETSPIHFGDNIREAGYDPAASRESLERILRATDPAEFAPMR